MKITPNVTKNVTKLEEMKPADSSLNIEKGKKSLKANVPVDENLLNISDDAKMVSKAIDIVKSTPDIRTDKVAELKKMINEGKYKINSEKLAEKIIEEHLLTDFGKNNL